MLPSAQTLRKVAKRGRRGNGRALESGFGEILPLGFGQQA